MKKKSGEKILSSPYLKNLQKQFKRIQKAEFYLEGEKRKLIENKKKIEIKIKKEKKILSLKKGIERLRERKHNHKKR